MTFHELSVQMIANPIFQAITFTSIVATAGIMAVVLGYIKSKNEEILVDALIFSPTRREPSDIETENRPFETVALSNYYKQALLRATVSFWFSLIAAGLGFGMIITAVLLHNSVDMVGTLLKVGSGVIVDAVSALFFVQSTNAQKSMGEFFEKLRLDRLNVEAREMIAEVENSEMRDQLRSQLILKYSDINRLLVGGGS